VVLATDSVRSRFAEFIASLRFVAYRCDQSNANYDGTQESSLSSSLWIILPPLPTAEATGELTELEKRAILVSNKWSFRHSKYYTRVRIDQMRTDERKDFLEGKVKDDYDKAQSYPRWRTANPELRKHTVPHITYVLLVSLTYSIHFHDFQSI